MHSLCIRNPPFYKGRTLSLFGYRSTANIFRPEDVGYFSPDSLATSIEEKGSNVYYDVFSFTDRLRFKANSIDADVMRQNINACLLGTAQDWYTKLDRLSKCGLRHAPNGIIDKHRATAIQPE